MHSLMICILRLLISMDSIKVCSRINRHTFHIISYNKQTTILLIKVIEICLFYFLNFILFKSLFDLKTTAHK